MNQHFQRPRYEFHIRKLPDIENHDLYCRAAAEYTTIVEAYVRLAQVEYGGRKFDFTQPLYWTRPAPEGTIRAHGLRAGILGQITQDRITVGMDRKASAERRLATAERGLAPYQRTTLVAIIIRGESTVQVGPGLHGKKNHDRHADAAWTYSTLRAALWTLAFNLGLLPGERALPDKMNEL
jgi:hypothetical protein